MLKVSKDKSIEQSNFDAKRKTKVIIHGFIDTPLSNWVKVGLSAISFEYSLNSYVFIILSGHEQIIMLPDRWLDESAEKGQFYFSLFLRVKIYAQTTKHAVAFNELRGSRAEQNSAVISPYIYLCNIYGPQEMRYELLLHGDYNIIVVDWAGGSLPLYTQATANTRLVGLELAHLIKHLQVREKYIQTDRNLNIYRGA